MTDAMPTTRFIRVDAPTDGHDGVALVTIDRPEARNALSFALLAELADALEELDRDGRTRVAVITGAGDRAFAAGADIVELADQTPERLRAEGHFDTWDRLGAIGIPLIAAVRGFALGGGCELAMTCDLIVAGDDAQFGQPEIRIGVMPGAGGTQRLTRAIGIARAMELVLTGRTMPAAEAHAAGLVTSVVSGRPGAPRRVRPGGSDRRHATAGRPGRQAVRPGGRRAPAERGPASRARGVLRPVRDRRPARGHARVPGEAAPGLDRPVTQPSHSMEDDHGA